MTGDRGCFRVPSIAVLVFRSVPEVFSRAKQPKGCDAKLQGLLPKGNDSQLHNLRRSGLFSCNEIICELARVSEQRKRWRTDGLFIPNRKESGRRNGTDPGFASLPVTGRECEE